MVFACSGAADVGEITDRAARRLQSERQAFMCCTAAIAAGVPEIVEKARGADRNLAIDGCAELCARKILERAGLDGFVSIRLDDLGMEKGRSRPTDEAVHNVVDRAGALLSDAAGDRADD